MRKIWKGLTFFKKTFQGWWVVAAYHHPDSITWRWSLSFDGRYPKKGWPKIGPGFYMGKEWRAPNGNFSAWLRIPFIGSFSFNTQDHLWKDGRDA